MDRPTRRDFLHPSGRDNLAITDVWTNLRLALRLIPVQTEFTVPSLFSRYAFKLLKARASMVVRHGRSGSDLWKAARNTVDRLFSILDQRRITASTGSSAIEVLGAHAMPDGGAWVQLAIVDEPTHGVLLHLRHTTAIDDVIDALNRWCETPTEERPGAIDLTPGLPWRVRTARKDYWLLTH